MSDWDRLKPAAQEIAKVFTEDELDALREELIAEWVVFDEASGEPAAADLWDAPVGAGRLIDLIHEASCYVRRPVTS